MTGVYPIQETEWSLDQAADNRNFLNWAFLNFLNVDSISPLVSQDYFPVLRAPVTAPSVTREGQEEERWEARFLLSPPRQAEEGHLA